MASRRFLQFTRCRAHFWERRLLMFMGDVVIFHSILKPKCLHNHFCDTFNACNAQRYFYISRNDVRRKKSNNNCDNSPLYREIEVAKEFSKFRMHIHLHDYLPWPLLYFFPAPQGQGSFLPTPL